MIPKKPWYVLGMKYSTKATYNDVVGAGRCKKIRDQSPGSCLVGHYNFKFSFSPSLRNPEQALKSALQYQGENLGHDNLLRPKGAFCCYNTSGD